MKQRFPPSARVVRGVDYKRCFAGGTRHGSRYFRLHLLQPRPPEPEVIEPEVEDATCQDANQTARLSDGHEATAREAKPATAAARLGLAVSRKFERRAVGRNRIKRLARERFRILRASLAPGDYVILPRREAAAAANAELVRDLDRLLQRAGALKATGAQGTMPDLGDTSTSAATAADDAAPS